MDVVNGLELGVDLRGEAVREGVRDLGEDVIACCNR